MNSAIPPACMDRYINRYVGPPHPVQQQPPQQHPAHQQQLLSQNGFYPHQQLLQQQQQAQQQQQQQQQHQQLSHGPPPPNFMVGCYSNASGWTGVPLISTAARRPRKFPPIVQNGPPGNHYQPNGKQPDFDENAMSRLALHAHGAPLILANNNNRYNRSNACNKPGPNKPNKVPSNHAPSRDDHLHHLKMVQAMGHQQQQQQQQQMSHPNDAQSVASDESGPNSGTSASSSSSSDTCLPRIIKPRKRRKKDRKPAPQAGSAQADPTPTSTTPSQTPQHPAVNQLLLDETTRDFLHEIALMANAGTFDFAGLIRDQQQQPVQLPQPPLQQQHMSSSSDSSDSGINNLACSCRLCDPFCKIWAFPLRRSCSDNSAEIELNRAKDVGVIGSNRSNSFRTEWRSSPHSLEQPEASSGSRKGSFSDSGDSGCDLLSGLTFCSEDILSSVNRELFLTPVDAGKEFKFPTSGGGGGSGGGGPNSISGSGSPNNSETPSEMLLISELTKKLNEGLDLRSSGSDSGSSAFSDSSVFGENSSPPATSDLFVNFDAISRNNLFSVNNISKLSNLLFEDNLTAPGLVINSVHQRPNHSAVAAAAPGVNYIRNVQNPPPPPPPPTTSEQRPFLFADNDQQRRSSSNFDVVWSNDRKLLPVEE